MSMNIDCNPSTQNTFSWLETEKEISRTFSKQQKSIYFVGFDLKEAKNATFRSSTNFPKKHQFLGSAEGINSSTPIRFPASGSEEKKRKEKEEKRRNCSSSNKKLLFSSRRHKSWKTLDLLKDPFFACCELVHVCVCVCECVWVPLRALYTFIHAYSLSLSPFSSHTN